MAAPKWRKLLLDFIDHLRIVSRDSAATLGEAGTKIKLWNSQRRILDEISAGMDQGIRKFYVLKSRQLGSSTIFVIILLFWLALHPKMKGALVTDTDKTRDSFREQIRNIIASIPAQYFGGAFGIKKGADNKYFMAFTNGSQLDFLVAGTSGNKTAWGESSGYTLVMLTEIASYGSSEGLTNFEEAITEVHPQRLIIYESTAKGFNHWRDRWLAAQKDPFTTRAIFVGWWAKEDNVIKRTDPRFAVYGLAPPDDRERTKMALVKDRHGHEITAEQLAWIRSKGAEGARSAASLEQNQPWVAEEAFVLSGKSYFMTRLIAQDMERITVWEGFRFWLGNDFWATQIERITEETRRHEVELRVWNHPRSDGRYVIGVDPAGGSDDKNDRHCLDRDTEILTRDGWRGYESVGVGDEAVCFNLATGEYSYGAISDKIVRPHSGPMIHMMNDGLDSLVTPEHRVVYRLPQPSGKNPYGPWKVKTAQEISDNQSTIKAVPTGGAPVGSGIGALSVAMCRALGWILTDGHIAELGGVEGGPRQGQKKIRPHIILAQALHTVKGGVCVADEMVRVIEALCPDASIRYHEPKNQNAAKVVIRIGAKASDTFIRWLPGQVCLKKDRRIPRNLITDTSFDQLEGLFQGILEGDGGWEDGKWVKVCPGLSEGLADDIQEIAIRLGYSATKTIQKAGTKGGEQWIVRLSPRPHHCVRKSDLVEHYDGDVWCVTVPTGAFVARRNGKVFVTGNCVSVWRCFADKLVQVAEYADNHADTRQCAWVLAYVAGMYKNCIINMELSGGYGKTVLIELNHLRDMLKADLYGNRRSVREEDWSDFLDNARYHLYRKPDSPASAGFVINWLTTNDNKNQIFGEFNDSHRTGSLVINSKPLLEEMQIIVQNGTSIGAPGNSKDDRTFAACLACHAWIEGERPSLIMQGESYDAVMARESGQSSMPGFVNKIVATYLAQARDGVGEEAPARTWLEERGLA